MSNKPVLKIGKTKHVEKREPLFELDGKVYTVLVNPSPNVGLTVMEMQTEKGVEAASIYMLKAMLGEDGFTALKNSPDVTTEEYEEVVKYISERVMGAQENAVKNS